MDADGGERGVTLYTADDFAKLRIAGQCAADTLDMIAEYVRPGITTGELDQIIHAYTLEHGAVPAPLNYRGYPKSSCISINHVVCHGIPGDKRLNDGDILNIDVTSIVDGWFGDSSRMYVAGNAPKRARKLMDLTYEALMIGVQEARQGRTLGDLGHAIQRFAEGHRLGVVRDFCGHGIGRNFHEAPSVLHYGRPGQGLTLRPGMVFTIEPMLNLGRPDVKVLDDGWTAVTRDRSLSAQFEHMIGITEDGCEIFTQSRAGLDRPYKGQE